MKTGKGGADQLRKILELADPSKTLTVRGLVDMPADEAEFQSRVRTVFVAHGWDFYHTRDSRGSDDGFPDCVIARPGRLFVAELKVKTDPTPDQLRWLALFQSAGIPAYLWRPADWNLIETIARNINGV